MPDCFHVRTLRKGVEAKRADVYEYEHAVAPPQRAREGTLPWNALPATMVTSMDFPSLLPQGQRPAPTYLPVPCATTKKHVHTEYIKAGGTAATFLKIWSSECSDVIIMAKRRCVRCMFRSAVSDRKGKNGRNSLKHTDALKAHIEVANVARDLYQKCTTAWHLIICQ